MNTGDRQIKPITPGEVLADALEDTETSVEQFATLSGIPLNDLQAIVANKKPIAQDIAEAIGKVLFTSPDLWLNLQSKVDNWDKHQQAILSEDFAND